MSKRYGNGTLALDNVTWSIRQGSRTCLLGPNGAGKSTSIRLLEGALAPTTGAVTLLGAAVNGPHYMPARRRCGVVPQSAGMYTDLTALEYLQLASRLYGGAPIDPLVELLALGPHLDKMLAQLSGGYQRRISVAAALVAAPDLLLLDEPTVGLDPVAASDVHRYLRDAMLHETRTTLLCTHNLSEAEDLCDEVVIMRRGKVLVQDSLENLRKREQPRLRLAVQQGAASLLQALLRRGLKAEAETERSSNGAAGAVLAHLERPREEAPGLLRGLLAEGLDVFECTVVEATLADLFLDLVRDAEDAGENEHKK